MNTKPNYYAIIPADVRYDKNLKPNAKLIYGEITCLSNKNGYCNASNNYFSALFEVTPQAVSNWVKSLEKLGYVSVSYEYENNRVKERRIYLQGVSINIDRVSIKDSRGINKSIGGYQQKFKDNNTSNNNTSNNIIGRKTDFKKSLHPFLDSYSKDILNEFFDYWTEKGDRDKKMRFEKKKNEQRSY